MHQNMQRMRTMIEAWRRRDIESFLDHLTEDIEYYWLMGKKPLRGREKMRKFLANYAANFDQREWHVLHHVEAGDLLMVEGREVIYDKACDRVIDHRFMQVCEFRDGRIAKMRDYYEPTNLKPPPAGAAAVTS